MQLLLDPKASPSQKMRIPFNPKGNKQKKKQKKKTVFQHLAKLKKKFKAIVMAH